LLLNHNFPINVRTTLERSLSDFNTAVDMMATATIHTVLGSTRPSYFHISILPMLEWRNRNTNTHVSFTANENSADSSYHKTQHIFHSKYSLGGFNRWVLTQWTHLHNSNMRHPVHTIDIMSVYTIQLQYQYTKQHQYFLLQISLR